MRKKFAPSQRPVCSFSCWNPNLRHSESAVSNRHESLLDSAGPFDGFLRRGLFADKVDLLLRAQLESVGCGGGRTAGVNAENVTQWQLLVELGVVLRVEERDHSRVQLPVVALAHRAFVREVNQPAFLQGLRILTLRVTHRLAKALDRNVVGRTICEEPTYQNVIEDLI